MKKLKVIPILQPNQYNKNPSYNKIKKIGKINMNKNYNKNMKEYLLIKNRINNLLIFNIKEDKIKFMKIKNLKNPINNKILKRQMLQFQVISFKKQNNILKINLNKQILHNTIINVLKFNNKKIFQNKNKKNLIQN